MRGKKICFCIAVTAMLLLSRNVSANGDLEIILDNKEVVLGSSIRMDLVFAEASGPAPGMPDIKGLKITHLRSTDIITRSEGKTIYGKRYTYLIIPEHPGIFTIGPFDFTHENKSYTFQKTQIQAISSFSDIGNPKQESSKEAAFKAEDNVFLTLNVSADRVFVNEIFQVEALLYFKDAQLADIKYPYLKHEGFFIQEFKAPRKSRQNIKGFMYHTIAFNSSAFAIAAGEQRLGPARISYNMQISDPLASSDLFSKNAKKNIPLSSESTDKAITVIPIPEKGRPEGFKGAVGNFKMDFDIKPRDVVKAGESIVLTMRITGKGNFTMLSAPYIARNDGIIYYQPDISEDSDSYKTFRQIIIPKSDAVNEIPCVLFSYFDPEEEKFVSIKKGPFPIRVLGAENKAVPEPQSFSEKTADPPADEPLGEGIIYIKESPGRLKKQGAYLYKSAGYLRLHIIPVFLYFAVLIGCTKYRRLKEDIGYRRRKKAYPQAKRDLARSNKALNRQNGEKFYSYLFVCMQEYFANKFNLPQAGVTADIIEKNMKKAGSSPHVIGQVRKFFDDCYIARFTPYKYKEPEMRDMFSRARSIVESCRRII